MKILFVGLGGFIGSVFRYKLSGFVLHHWGNSKTVSGTLIVNLLGAFIIGVLMGYIEVHHVFKQELRIFLITGILGGFTTFSAFGYEVMYLIRRGYFFDSFLVVFLTVLGGLFFVWFGMKLVSLSI